MGLFEMLSDEANSRVIGNVTSIIQVLGLVIPAVTASIAYAVRTRRRSRAQVIEFLREWNSLEKRRERQHRSALIESIEDLIELMKDEERSESYVALLNEYEFLAAFVLSDGRRSWRMKFTKKFLSADVVSTWRSASYFVEHIRARWNPHAFMEFERLVEEWRK